MIQCIARNDPASDPLDITLLQTENKSCIQPAYTYAIREFIIGSQFLINILSDKLSIKHSTLLSNVSESPLAAGHTADSAFEHPVASC